LRERFTRERVMIFSYGKGKPERNSTLS
jgi:hypothetical protein